jgi:hypothetical protein
MQTYKCRSNSALFQSEDETVSMLITEEDVSVFFDRCCDLSLATRKQALTSLSELVQARPADGVLQDAWVTGMYICTCIEPYNDICIVMHRNTYIYLCIYKYIHTCIYLYYVNIYIYLYIYTNIYSNKYTYIGALPLATDPESSIQQKLAQCSFDLLIANAVTWAKQYTSKDTGVSDLSISLVWNLCARISETGRSKLLKTCISTMLRQDVIKSIPLTSKPVSFSNVSSSNMNVILQVVKLACCVGLHEDEGLVSSTSLAEKEQISRG